MSWINASDNDCRFAVMYKLPSKCGLPIPEEYKGKGHFGVNIAGVANLTYQGDLFGTVSTSRRDLEKKSKNSIAVAGRQIDFGISAGSDFAKSVDDFESLSECDIRRRSEHNMDNCAFDEQHHTGIGGSKSGEDSSISSKGSDGSSNGNEGSAHENAATAAAGLVSTFSGDDDGNVILQAGQVERYQLPPGVVIVERVEPDSPNGM